MGRESKSVGVGTGHGNSVEGVTPLPPPHCRPLGVQENRKPKHSLLFLSYPLVTRQSPVKVNPKGQRTDFYLQLGSDLSIHILILVAEQDATVCCLGLHHHATQGYLCISVSLTYGS